MSEPYNYQHHKNPIHDNRLIGGRTASSPYNFVPVPEVVATVEELPDQGQLVHMEERYTGYFDVTLKTLSPMYIRGPLTLEQEKLEDRVKTTAFFHGKDPGQPIIPGSSLKGMLRNLVSIIAYGKLERVANKSLYFRERGNKFYLKKFGDLSVAEVNAKPGFIVKRNNAYFIAPCKIARVDPGKFENYSDLFMGHGPNAYPRWEAESGKLGQYNPAWVTTEDRKGIDYVKAIKADHHAGAREGRLVLTGNTTVKAVDSDKAFHFVFFEPSRNPEDLIPVDKDLLERFHLDQLTPLQRMAFSKDKPTADCRKEDGWIRTNPGKRDTDWGDPVFYLLKESGSKDSDTQKRLPAESKQLYFFGRALYFRIPFPKTPREMLPDYARDEQQVDFTEALFGYADKEKRKPHRHSSYKGRVVISDGVLKSTDKRPTELFSEEITPRILSSPRPTSYQHYLVQHTPVDSDRQRFSQKHMQTYADETTLRGHKMYWHQGDAAHTNEAWVQHIKTQENVDLSDTQHTRLRAINTDVEFTFKVHFENLSKVELGALCWALKPNGEAGKTYAHKLGMGKSLGMGSVQLCATLYKINLEDRYSKLFDGDGWETGEEKPVKLGENYDLLPEISAFENYMLDKVLESVWEDEKTPSRPTRLRQMRRIAYLLKVLEWRGQTPVDGERSPLLIDNNAEHPLADKQPNTRYMDVGEFAKRPVLPDPGWYGAGLPSILGRPGKKSKE